MQIRFTELYEKMGTSTVVEGNCLFHFPHTNLFNIIQIFPYKPRECNWYNK
jgi:hypothetical protein